MDRFFVACCVFSLITGMYATEMIQRTMIDKHKGCTVEVTEGRITTVRIGKTDD